MHTEVYCFELNLKTQHIAYGTGFSLHTFQTASWMGTERGTLFKFGLKLS